MRGGARLTLLLVSPRDVEEALIAVKGGADILDVKNPSEGSLGANFPWVITEIRRAVPSRIPLSAALGDFPNLPGSAALAALGAVKAGADIVKIGLKGPEDAESASYLVEQVVKAVRGADERAKVVACAYGDFQRAGTLDPSLLPEVAARAGADVAMLDTALKDGKPLTDFLGAEELGGFIEAVHARGLSAALAGSLGVEELRVLKRLKPDVLGVRGAACEGGDRRSGRISEERVRMLKQILEG